jgi:2-haloacid dehalogenase
VPRILVFDVNETLLDVSALAPHFVRIFHDAGTLREWFSTLLLYSQVATLTDLYRDFSTIAGAALEMVAKGRGVVLSAEDRTGVLEAMLSLPAHPDVREGLQRLRDEGFRLVALTNSSRHAVEAQIANAGLLDLFEHTFSVDAVRRFKPAPEPYRFVAGELGVDTSGLRMVAAHAWDIVGAMRAGCAAAFVARPGKSLYPLAPLPDIVARDLRDVAEQIITLESARR